MSDKLRDENVDYLFKAILKLNTVDECYDFFEDLCTVTEIKALSQRIAVAKIAQAKDGLQRYRRRHGRQHRHHQPRQPLASIRL